MQVDGKHKDNDIPDSLFDRHLPPQGNKLFIPNSIKKQEMILEVIKLIVLEFRKTLPD